MRASDLSIRKAGHIRWTALAIEQSFAQTIGFYEVLWNPRRPEVVGGGRGCVLPRYRGAGVMSTLKAMMLLRIVNVRPSVTQVEAAVDSDNAPMLRVNERFSYVTRRAIGWWRVPAHDARAGITRYC